MKKNKRKIIIITIIIFIALIIGIVTTILLLNNKKEDPKETILLKDNLDVEINSEVNLLSFISEENKVKIVSEDETIDTSKLGEQELKIKYLDKEKEEEYIFKIKVVDTKAPTIEYEKEISTTEGTEIDLLKDVKVNDNSKEEIKATIEGEYDINKVGTYNLKYVAEDSSKNKVEEEFILKVNEKPKETTKPKTNTSSNNTSSNNSNNSSSSSKENSQSQQQGVETNYPMYSFVSEEVWRTSSNQHIRRITYYWYVNYIERDENGNVNYVEWGVSCDSGMGMPAVENAKSHMPAPPSGQEAVNMYNANNKVHYGSTVLYTVIP